MAEVHRKRGDRGSPREEPAGTHLGCIGQFADIGATAGAVRQTFRILHAAWWLRGKLNVRLDTLVQIANGLDMPAWELLRIAEIGAGGGETLRGSGAGSREGPYGREATKSSSNAAVRRKVAEDRDR